MDSQRLYEIIKSSGINFGSTAMGAEWCVKALHPAHPVGPIVGIPDRTSVPSALLEFKGNFTISTPEAGASWGTTLMALPSPITPIIYRSVSEDGTPVSSNVTLSNTQIQGTSQADKVAFWRTNVTAARIVYYGLTIILDSPTLYDQGSAVMGQITPSWRYTYTSLNGDPEASYASQSISYDTLINLRQAVQFSAKEGGYLPMKFSNPSIPYVEQTTTYGYSGLIYGAQPALLVPHMLDTQLGGYAARNLASVAMLRCIWRMGVEVTCPPGSAYTPFMTTMGIPDSIALDSYYSISSKMADAYPSSFNDWDELWSVIKGVGRVVLPAIKTVVPYGREILQGLKNVYDVGKTAVQASRAVAARKRAKRKKGNGNAPKTTPATPTAKK
jgi:hypothetical protein